MKTLLQLFTLLFFLFLFFPIVHAQTQQGSFRVGGNANYSNVKLGDDNQVRYLSLYPSLAYFPVTNLSVGLAINTTFSSGDNSTSTTKSTDYSIGPELRYYFPFGKWALFPEVAYSFGKSISKVKGTNIIGGDPILYDNETKSTYSSFRGGVGLTYFVNPNIGVEGILFYQNYTHPDVSPYSGPSKSKSINFSVGFQIYLNKK